MKEASQIKLIGLGAFRIVPGDLLADRACKTHFEFCRDVACQFALQFKEICGLPIVAIAPELIASGRVHHLDIQQDLIAALPLKSQPALELLPIGQLNASMKRVAIEPFCIRMLLSCG